MNDNHLAVVKNAVQADIDTGRMFGASLIVAHKGKVVLRECLGTADGAKPLDANSIFLMMSATKSFTAVLALKAVEDGWFQLDSRVADILPEFDTDDKKGINVYHLLTHQAGILSGKLYMPELANPMTDTHDIDKVLAHAAKTPVDFGAGTQSWYSPLASIGILANILERTDPQGRKFTQIAQEELFAPLGMSSTRFGNAKTDPNWVKVTHTPLMEQASSTLGGNARLVQDYLNGFADEHAVLPAGNAFGTIDDLFAFAENMRLDMAGKGKRILSPAMMKYATQNHTGDKINDSFKAEWQRLNVPPLRSSFGLHGGYARGTGHVLNVCGYLASPAAFGGMGGGSTHYMVDPERELTVAFLSAGFIEGLAHMQRVAKLNDLIVGACD